MPSPHSPKKDLIEVQKRLEAIIETALDGIITIDSGGKIESINRAGAELFGYTIGELTGQPVSILMSSPHRNRHQEYIANYLTTGIPKIIGTKREETGRKKDGTLFPLRLSISEVHLTDQRIFTGIIHDLSEEKKNEEAIIRINRDLESLVAKQTFELQLAVERLLESNQRLEEEIHQKTEVEARLRASRAELEAALEKERELNEMKSRFVSMTSHEFRTPLSTIFSSASIIDRYPNTDQQSNREKHTRKIRNSVTMLISILDEFLNLARLEKDVVIVNTPQAAYSLNAFCQETINELESLLKEGQHISFTASDPDHMIWLDPSLLKQILYNILSNAIKYSNPGGLIRLGCSIRQKTLELRIEDEGIGIPIEEQKHLFTRFFRASNSTHIQGTGLGLNLVLHYLKLLNGKISFESEENQGTVFMVEIPE